MLNPQQNGRVSPTRIFGLEKRRLETLVTTEYFLRLSIYVLKRKLDTLVTGLVVCFAVLKVRGLGAQPPCSHLSPLQ